MRKLPKKTIIVALLLCLLGALFAFFSTRAMVSHGPKFDQLIQYNLTSEHLSSHFLMDCTFSMIEEQFFETVESKAAAFAQLPSDWTAGSSADMMRFNRSASSWVYRYSFVHFEEGVGGKNTVFVRNQFSLGPC